MSNFTIARDIRYKISQGKPQEAIDLLQSFQAVNPDILEAILLKSAQYNSLAKQIQMGTIGREDADITQQKLFKDLLNIANELEESEKENTRIFVSFCPDTEDRALARTFHDALEEEGFNVFLSDVDLSLGENKLERIQNELQLCEFFLLLLSECSNESDLLLKEVKIVKYIQDTHSEGKPIILPIRVKLPQSYPLNYDLSGYLEGIHAASWNSTNDTDSIVQEVVNAIKFPVAPSETLEDILDIPEELEVDPEPAETISPSDISFDMDRPLPKAHLEPPFGSVAVDSHFYVQRDGEEHFMEAISSKGAVLRVKGPRQFGKTSLMSRIIAKGRGEGYYVSSWSMQFMETLSLTDLDLLLKRMCVHISDDLDLDKKASRTLLRELWEDELLDAKMKCTHFFTEFLFPKLNGVIFLAIDEADRLFEYDEVSNDFFGLLRSWHDRRSSDEIWDNFRLAVSYSTEIHLAIKEIDQSPFNVGLESNLRVFNAEEVGSLIDRHELNLGHQQIDSLLSLLGGHPFLTRKALYQLATEKYSFDELVRTASEPEGPFRDHLKRHLWNVSQNPACIPVFQEIMKGQSPSNPNLAARLRSAGLIKGAFPNFDLSLGLYKDFFSTHLEGIT